MKLSARSRRRHSPPNGLRHIFVFVLGTTPQVVTETLWWFWKKHRPSIKPSELHLITTTKSEKKARDLLLGDSGAVARLAREYSFAVPRTTFHRLLDSRGRPLSDIRTAAANSASSRRILNLATKVTADPGTVCHFSLAGGRRTMAVHLACAVMFRGRSSDTLSHILAPVSLEADQTKFFPKKNDPGRGIDLAFLPFLRLRDHIDPGFDLEKSIAAFQGRLERGQALPRIRLNLRDRAMTVGDHEIRLPHQQLALWCVYALGSEKGFTVQQLLDNGELFLKYLSRIESPMPETGLESEWRRYLGGDESVRENLESRLLQLRSKLVRKLHDLLGDRYLDLYVNVRPLQRGTRPVAYGVKATRSRIVISESSAE